MINIIQDPNKIYEGNVDIVVDDTASFIKSRLLIDNVKEGLRARVDIVVIRPSYYKYYDDLYGIKDWTNVIDYSFEKAIKDRGIDTGKIAIKRIESVIDDKREIFIFLEGYNNNYSLEENLIIYLFHEGKCLIETTDYIGLIKWLESSINKDKICWADKRFRVLLDNNLHISLDRNLADRLFSIRTIAELEELQISLVASYMFSEYPMSSKNVIRTRITWKDDIIIAEELMLEIIKAYPNILSQINLIVSSMKNKLSLFEEKELDLFLKRTQGYLDEEWIWVWEYIRNNFNIKMEEKLSRIDIWLNIDKHRNKIETLRELLAFMELKESYTIPEDITGWFNYYKNIHLKWFPDMDHEKNILNKLDDLSETFVSDFISQISYYKNQMEKNYQNFLFKNYPVLIREDYTNLKVIKQIQAYVGKNKILFFVIDGLRFELWNSIKNVLQENEYFAENAEQECVSTLPSITSISRTGLITGRTFKSLVEEKAYEEYSFCIYNEEKHLKRDFPGYSIVYAKGGLSTIDHLLEENADIYTLIFSQGDSIFHASDSITKDTMEVLFNDLIRKIIEKVSKYDDMIIVIGTDHGSISLKNATKIIMDIPDTIDIDQQGNCVVLKSHEFKEELYKEIQEKIENSKWYTVWREDSPRFGLPCTINHEEIYGWLFPKSGFYYGRNPTGYNHGGLSMEETIIPYGIFRRQHGVFEELQIAICESHLLPGELSYLEFIIYNPNIFSIKKINVNLLEIGATRSIRDLASKERKKVKFEFILKDNHYIGDYLKGTAKLKISYLNEFIEQSHKLSEKIEQTVVSAINKQISKGRTLDF